MNFMGYDATLSHGHSARGPTGFCRVESTPLPRRPVVRTRRVASGRGPGVGRDADDRLSLVSRLESQGAGRAQGSRASRPETPAGHRAAGAPRCRLARGRTGARVPDGSVDAAPRGGGDRAPDRRPVSPRPCLVPGAAAELVTAAAGPAGARTRRCDDSAVGAPALARGKKNARRQRAWLLFEDESGLSTQPVVRRTWAPRGETPVLTHPFRHWERLSIAAALAFRWDGHRTNLFFQTRSGPYTAAALISFLRQLHRHFQGRRVILLWDG